MDNEAEREDVSPAQPAPEKPPASIHDTYVFKVLSDPVQAAAQIRYVLGEKLAQEIDWNDLELDPHRYVDENLGNHFTDLLFKTTLRKKPIRLRFLLEHSSHPKRYELLQVLRYQLRQWEKDLEQNPRCEHLTPIITIILHHSDRGWRGQPRFGDYFGLDEEMAELLRPYLVDFGILVDDISREKTESLLERPVPPEVQLLLFGLRHARTGRRILEELRKLVPLLRDLMQQPNGALALGVFVVYIRQVARVAEADVRTALDELIESRLDPDIMAVYKQFDAGLKKGLEKGLKEGLEKGLKKGLEEGLEKGLKEGGKRGEKRGKREGKLEMARSMLSRLLEQRFGTLSASVVKRIEAAKLPELDAMTLRVLTATSVEEVLRG